MKDLKASITDEYLQDIERKVQQFEEVNKRFLEKLADFEEKYKTELEMLDALREERNVKLDEIKRSLRSYAETTKDVPGVELGNFKVVRKWSKFYNHDKLVRKLSDFGLMNAAISEEIVVNSVQIAKYEKVRAFLEKHGVTQEFESCEDGDDAGIAIYGPKPVPMFGASE